MADKTPNLDRVVSALRPRKVSTLRRWVEGMRTMRRPSPALFSPLMIAVASLGAIIAAALLFGSPAPAHADTEVLVSNVGQTPDANHYLEFHYDHAQSFTSSGKSSRYYLESVELRVKKAPSGTGALTVSIHADHPSADGPGDLLYTLTNPPNFGTGTKTFSAPDHATLEGNTKYWVQMVYTGGGSIPELRLTLSQSEDSSSAPGWSIGDTSYRFRWIEDIWIEDTGPIQIRVNGRSEPEYVSNTGQDIAPLTLQVGATTYAQGFTTGGGPVGRYLGSVDLVVWRAPGSGTLKVTVREKNSSDKPGDLRYRLTNPTITGRGTYSFHAPEGAWLSRNNKYFVRIVYDGGGTEPQFRATTYTVEDSGGYSGWSIFDQHHHRPRASGSWTSYVNPLKMTVKGPGVDAPAPAAPTNLSAVAGDGRATVTWDNPENISIRKYQYSTDGGSSFNHMNGRGKTLPRSPSIT